MSLLRRTVLGVVAVLVAGGVAVPPGPASAAYVDSDPWGTLKVVDLVTGPSRCATEVVEFVPTAAVHDWYMSVRLSDGNGVELGNTMLYPSTPKHAFTLCPGKFRPGDVKVDGYLQGWTGPNETGSQVATGYDSAFSFRVIDRKPTAITVRTARSHSKNCPLGRTKHCTLVTATITRAGKPFPWPWLQIQAFQRGRWVRKAWGHAGPGGKVQWWVVIGSKERRLKFRVLFETADNARGSVSRTFRVKY